MVADMLSAVLPAVSAAAPGAINRALALSQPFDITR
jgi:hypothetical protein